MSITKFCVFAVFVSFLAFTIQIVDQLLCGMVPPAGNFGFGWIAFQSWAMYFLAGCTLSGAKEVVVGYVGGIVAAIAIIMLAGNLSAAGSFMSVPIAIFFVVIPLILLMRTGWNSLVPAIFVGSGVYFAFFNYVPKAVGLEGMHFCSIGLTEMIYCVLGLFYGWMTVTFLNWWTAKVAKEEK